MGAGCSSEKATATQASPVAPAPAEHKASSSAPSGGAAATSKEDPKAAAAVSPAPADGGASAADGSGPAEAQLPPAPPEDENLDDAGEGEGAHNPEARLESLRRCFDALDKDKSGTIDFKEMKQYLFKTGVNIHQIVGKAEELMKKMDLNDDNLISLEEFTQMMEALMADKSDEDLDVWVAEVVFTATSRNVVGFGNSLGEVLANLDLSQAQVLQIKACFKELDRDNSGFVELPELKLLLGKAGLDMDTVSEDVVALMHKLDKNGDGKISEQEFFVTLSAIRKHINADVAFAALLDNVVAVAKSPEEAEGKPALTEVLLQDVAD